MKSIGILLFFIIMIGDPAKTGKINSLKSEAKSAYLKGDFKTAIQKYKYLVDSLNVQEDEVLLNLANAYFQLNDTANAAGQYLPLTQSSKNQIRSKAHQQLGVLKNRQGKSEEALNHFKESIKSDPTNEDARYNYEMLKKKLEEQKKQDQQNKDQNKDEKKDQDKQDQKDKKEDQKKDQEKKDQEKKDQEKKDQEKKDQQNKEQKQEEAKDQKEKKDEKKDPSISQKLQQMDMTEEKAKMILEAMKNQEKQYLQQNKRKATKPKGKGKPDW